MLDEAVLALARLYHQGILAMPEDEDRNRAYRHTAYRQFGLWHNGRLGLETDESSKVVVFGA